VSPLERYLSAKNTKDFQNVYAKYVSLPMPLENELGSLSESRAKLGFFPFLILKQIFPH
jgi:hypothetical protein